MRTEPSREDVRDAAFAAFRGVFGAEPPRGLDTAPDDVPDWSSLAQVRLMHAVEQELGCVLDERFLTVGGTLGELVDSACVAVGVTNVA
ncbi:hypothetical protein [Rhizomonospora bruguierae]|uniref:hypothetical protein n=1 Tax=Rhizomonospora bruguierae TaxID=1581705 RepID=UPI001BD0EDAF|nr:hypothetical protein [Micromonospora sp. NBRC 107566]